MKTLVSALNWGLGHTTRIIPIIQKLQEQDEEIIIGAAKEQERIYKAFFPDIKIIELASSGPVYSSRSNQTLAIAQFLPRFLINYIREHKKLKIIIRNEGISKVISDNRYGLYNKKLLSILITHQARIILPRPIRFLEKLANRFITRSINRFNECWIPDYPDQTKLAGKLVNPLFRLRTEQKFIGICSRFSVAKEEPFDNIPTILVLISGPEKQRTLFEKKISSLLNRIEPKVNYLILRGLEYDRENDIPNSLNNCTSEQMKTLIRKSSKIICRSGYSTLMDLEYLERKALLIPTPGQTEQEYLATYNSSERAYQMLEQDQLNEFNLFASLAKL